MEKITYAQYLQENVGVISIGECLDVMSQAEQGKLSDLEIEEQLTPVVGTVLSELFNSDRETFEHLLERIKTAAKKIQQQQQTTKIELLPIGDAFEILPIIEKILDHIRDGFTLQDHWLDEDGVLIVVLGDPEGKNKCGGES